MEEPARFAEWTDDVALIRQLARRNPHRRLLCRPTVHLRTSLLRLRPRRTEGLPRWRDPGSRLPLMRPPFGWDIRVRRRSLGQLETVSAPSALGSLRLRSSALVRWRDR